MPDLQRPGALEHLADEPIRLIVADIDGCLSSGAGSPFETHLVHQLAEANRASRTDITVPAITLCTGRPQPYVECLLQAIHGYIPALCESGTVFFDPVTHSILTHEDFGKKQEEQLAELHLEIAREFKGRNVKPEPGKMTHITLIVQPPDCPEALFDKAVGIAARFGDTFQVELTSICVHFLFRHLHKGTGVNWLSEDTGIPLAQMAGIGDAAPDLPFLKLIGLAYAPANAHEEVKQACHAVSKLNDSSAMLELLEMIIAHNRRLKEEGLLKHLEVTAG